MPALQLDNHLNDFAVVAFGGSIQYDITAFVTDISWNDSFDQPSMQVDISCANPNHALNKVIHVGTGLRVFAALPQPDGSWIPLRKIYKAGEWFGYSTQNELFRGFVFTRTTNSLAVQEEMTLSCYDNMIYLAKNEIDKTFKNRTATEIILAICDEYGLRHADPGPDFQDTNYKIPKMLTTGLTLYDACYLALQKTHDLNKQKRYLLHSEKGLITLRERQTPNQVWNLTLDHNVTEFDRTYSLEDSYTRITLSTTQDTGRKVAAGIVSNPRMERLFGVMTKVQDSSTTDAVTTRKAAYESIRTEGWPSEEMTITIPCVNSLRPGHQVRFSDNRVKSTDYVEGIFYIEGITHDVGPSQSTSTLTIVRKIEQADVALVTEPTANYNLPQTRYISKKGKNGQIIRIRVTIAEVYTPSSSGQVGDEDVIQIDSANTSLKGLNGDHVRLQSPSHSKQCVVESATKIANGDIRISRAVANAIGAKAGDRVNLIPMVAVTGTSASAAGTPSTYDSLIDANAGNLGGQVANPAALIKAVIEQESGFQKGVTSGAGAIGLMQLLPGTARGMGWTESEGSLSTPSVNIKYGTKYLGNALTEFHGNVQLALAAYNAGSGAVHAYGNKVPPFAETQNYVKVVMANYQKYSAQ